MMVIKIVIGMIVMQKDKDIMMMINTGEQVQADQEKNMIEEIRVIPHINSVDHMIDKETGVYHHHVRKKGQETDHDRMFIVLILYKDICN